MAAGSSFSGRIGGSFPEERLVMKPPRRPAVVFLLRLVYSCDPAMSGIIKVIVSFFRKSEEVTIERHRSRVPADKEKHKGVWVKKTSNRERYIDDIFSLWDICKPEIETYVEQANSHHRPKSLTLRLYSWIQLYKGDRFKEHSILDIKTQF